VKISQVSAKTRKWIQDVWGIDFYSLEEIAEPPPAPPIASYPEPIIQLGKEFAMEHSRTVSSFITKHLLIEFIGGIKEAGVHFSLDGEDRLFRGHGQSMYDIMHVRQREIERIPDVVIWAGTAVRCICRL
jgi:hypothetical protein